MGSAAPVRRRRKVRLADLPIGAKLGLLVVPPSAAVVVLAIVAAAALGAPVLTRAGGPADLRSLATTAVHAADVVETLHQERLIATLLLYHVFPPDDASDAAAPPDADAAGAGGGDQPGP